MLNGEVACTKTSHILLLVVWTDTSFIIHMITVSQSLNIASLVKGIERARFESLLWYRFVTRSVAFFCSISSLSKTNTSVWKKRAVTAPVTVKVALCQNPPSKDSLDCNLEWGNAGNAYYSNPEHKSAKTLNTRSPKCWINEMRTQNYQNQEHT